MTLSRIRPAHLVQFVALLVTLMVLAHYPALLRRGAGWLGLTVCLAVAFDLTGGALLVERLIRRGKVPGPLPVLLIGSVLAFLLLPGLRPWSLILLASAGVFGLARTLRELEHPWTLLLRAPWACPERQADRVLFTTHQRGNWATYVWMYLLMDLPLHILLAFAGLGWLALLDLLNVAGMALLARSFRAYPCVLTAGHLTVSMGALHCAQLPLGSILKVRPYVPGSAGKSLVFLTPPNVTLCLNLPVRVHSLLGRSRPESVLHIYLDDPAALFTTLKDR